MISALESILCGSILGKMLLGIGLDKKKGHAWGLGKLVASKGMVAVGSHDVKRLLYVMII